MLCLACGSLAAQSISGRVIDSEGIPVAGASCVLTCPADSSYVAGTTTDIDGKFILDVSEDREYRLRLSFIGFTAKML